MQAALARHNLQGPAPPWPCQTLAGPTWSQVGTHTELRPRPAGSKAAL